MNEVEKYKKKLEIAEQKVRILEDMIENSTRELYSTNQDLERKNKEIEQFAYIVSHDLQEPLRTVSSFIKLLDTQYKGQLDEKADRYLQFITDSSLRMSLLIRELLDFSRIGKNKKLEAVDCDSLLNNITADLGNLISEKKACITYKNLPTVNAFKTDLRQLFQNLINNGIKFSRADTPPEIEISALQKNNKWEFSIKDNGIGIDPKYHERVFVIFQRLHNRGEYDGTGIGLAHCKKIADLHGGDIWVKSAPGKGSTFYFTIEE